MFIYSIKNSKIGHFNIPMYCESDAEAFSAIQKVILNDSDLVLHGLKNDLDLMELGTIDFTTGTIKPHIYHDDEDEYGITCDIATPRFVCSIRDIYDSIPDDLMKSSVDHSADFERIDKAFHVFESKLNELEERIAKCKKVK